METNKVSEQYIASCFVNGLEAYDGEINLAFDENLISNKYAVKLCLYYKVKKGNKVVKKELVVALKGELYFVKFIIVLKEDDVEPGTILGRSFIRLAKGIVNFANKVITIYPKLDLFKDDFEKPEKSLDEWDQLLDFNFDDVPTFGEELPLLVCKMRKSKHNKKRSMENLSLFYQDIRPSLSAGGHLTQEEEAKEALAIRISQMFTLLEEVDLNGKIIKEEEEAVQRIKGRENMKKVDTGITMINHTQAEAMRILTNILCQVGVITIIAKFIILDIPIDHDAPIVTMGTHDDKSESSQSKPSRQNEIVEEVLLLQVHMNFCYGKVVAEKLSLEIDDMLRIRLRAARSDEEIFTSVAWIRAFNINEPIYTELCHEFYLTYEFDKFYTDNELQTKKIIKFRLGGRNVLRSLSATVYCRDLDTTTLRELIDSESRLISKDLQSSVPRVGIPRPSKESMQNLYASIGRMEIRQAAIERMEYR
nr:hypothetical protein [Tanacetum cinerariifolium]